MSARSHQELITKNARYYDPPQDYPGDQLLNVSAIAKDYGISRPAFYCRQERGWWPGRNKPLEPFPVTYRGDQGEPRRESAFLRSQVEEAIKPAQVVIDGATGDKPAWIDELRTLKDGKSGITLGGILKLWDVSPMTARKWIHDEDMEYEGGKSPITGKREKWFPLAKAEAVKKKRERRKRLPKRIGKRCKDGQVRVFVRCDIAAKLLAVTRSYLWLWENKGCQHLDGAKLQSTTRESGKSCPVAYYLEEQINTIKEARKDLPPAPDMPLTLTEAAAQTRERGPALSKVFLFRNLARTIDETGKDSRFVSGGIPSEEVTPPSIHGKGKPQYTILPSDLRRLQDAVRAAFREARKSLPAGWGTAADVERELGAGQGRDRALVKGRLRELVKCGQLVMRSFWRLGGTQVRIRRMSIYPLAKAVARLRGEEDTEGVTSAVSTPAGMASQLAPPLADGAPAPTCPLWDEMTATLYWGATAIRIFQNAAKNQRDIVEAFHRANWDRTIPDPLRNPRKLNVTISDLNRSLSPKLIKFRGDGTGDGIMWEPAK